ncbi:MAG: enoyl-CoA hydratase/isomerase [Pseudomonadota bacterium]
MTFKKIAYSVENDIATIALNDPQTMNAAGMDMIEELSVAIEQAAEDARCTIITGNGRGFCSGANLSANPDQAPQKGKLDAGKPLDTHYNPFIKAMRTHPHPIITAVNGAAAGVGCSIALMGDFIICSEGAYFLQAFRRIGLVPDGGSTFLLPRLIGRARAMEMTLFGDKVFAEQALEWGLVNRIVPDDQLMSEASSYAQRLADGPTQALAMIRDLVWQAEDNDFDAQLQAERFAQRTAGRQPDFREGVKAFLEKRPADFRQS